MTIDSIKAKELGDQGNISRAVPSLSLVNEHQDLGYVITLAAATKERRQAALRISELAKQAVTTLLNSV